MAYAVFSPYLSYNIGDIVTYENYAYMFIKPHVPGEWDAVQVVQINPATAYHTVQDFNTLPDYNLSSPLSPPKYHINYHVNNDAIVINNQFANDTKSYSVGDVAVIQGYPYQHFSDNGVWVYTFTGWSLLKGSSSAVNYVPGHEVTITNHDIDLYAQWSKEPTIIVDTTGELVLKPEYKDGISHLIIPEYFGGSRINTIGSNAFVNASISEIVIPPSIIEVSGTAFYNWSGSTLRFIDADVTTKYPLLTLNAGCFQKTPNLTNILLPYRWRAAGGVLFPAQFKDTLTIKIRNTKLFMNEQLATADAETFIAEASDPGMNYERIIHWGYND